MINKSIRWKKNPMDKLLNGYIGYETSTQWPISSLGQLDLYANITYALVPSSKHTKNKKLNVNHIKPFYFWYQLNKIQETKDYVKNNTRGGRLDGSVG